MAPGPCRKRPTAALPHYPNPRQGISASTSTTLLLLYFLQPFGETLQGYSRCQCPPRVLEGPTCPRAMYECNDNYERCGSAMPFPDCVFLPTFWGFACASCIARHRAVECSFNIIRAEYREQCWEMIQIPVYGVASPVSKWLERGHPLLASDPQTLYTLWKRRDFGNDPTHDLTQPTQESSFIWPPDVPNARLPDCSQQLSASSPSDLGERLSLLREQFRTKRNIVVITGAGISTNAGSKS